MSAAHCTRQTVSARQRLVALSRHHGPNDPATNDARRILRYLKLADHIRREVATWPPFTEEQRADLRALLGGGDAADG